MVGEIHAVLRFFLSYTGVKLPLTLVTPISETALSNRNTYIRAYFDKRGALVCFEKIVYGEVEIAHRYEYHANGSLKLAEISMPEEEPQIMCFDETGARLSDN